MSSNFFAVEASISKQWTQSHIHEQLILITHVLFDLCQKNLKRFYFEEPVCGIMLEFLVEGFEYQICSGLCFMLRVFQ